MDKTTLAFVTVASAGAATTVFFLWSWLCCNKRQQEKTPSRWRKVGELNDLVCFPVKSLGPVRMTFMECTPLGLKSGWLRDRSLMVIDCSGQFVTARQFPRMVQVSPSVSGSELTLRAPQMLSVTIDLAKIRGEYFHATIWGQTVHACDCGEEIANWLSRFLLKENAGLRLVYYPLDRPSREVRTKNKIFRLMDTVDTGAYPDATSYSLLNESSLSDLNNHMEKPINSLHFRMNFVVKGANVFEEDFWNWIKIGNTIFRNVKPCTRCIFTTIDPETGKKDLNTEPLKTLKGYRQINDPTLLSATGGSPVMGIHLGLRSGNSIIRLGDPVFVEV